MNGRDVVDALIEAPVVTSFTRIGYAVRARLDGWRPLDEYDLAGRVIVLTGATSGLGQAAASATRRVRRHARARRAPCRPERRDRHRDHRIVR